MSNGRINEYQEKVSTYFTDYKKHPTTLTTLNLCTTNEARYQKYISHISKNLYMKKLELNTIHILTFRGQTKMFVVFLQER